MPAPLLPESNSIPDGLPVLSIVLLHSHRDKFCNKFFFCVSLVVQ